jgi:hypothetical protein
VWLGLRGNTSTGCDCCVRVCVCVDMCVCVWVLHLASVLSRFFQHLPNALDRYAQVRDEDNIKQVRGREGGREGGGREYAWTVCGLVV